MSFESTRRGFFATTAGAMAAAGATPAATADEAARNDLKLGVATYSFREFGRRMAINGCKALGVKYVSIKEFHLSYKSTPEELRRGKAEFDKAGLTVLSNGNNTIQKEDPDDIKFYFEYAKNAGIPMLVIAPTEKTLPMIEKFVQQYDIKVAVHNHGTEDKHFPSPQSVLKVIKNMDPRVGLCMDIGHSVRAGADIVESAAEAGPRLLDMHVKDLKNMNDRDSQCDVGEGVLPIVALFKQLKKMNYQGGVMLEYEINGENPLPGMQKSFSYMRGVLAGLRG